MAKEYTVKLIRKEKVANDVWLFVFEKPERYVFTPGQYQTFTFSLPDGKIDWRDMTITSSPKQNELWMVTKIGENPSLFKQTLLNLPIGSVVRLEGPSGGFTIRNKEKSHVFLAGGIGINVFHSIIKGAEEESLDTRITLFASFREKRNIVYYNELKQVENEKRKIIYTLTQDDWEGEKGRISESMIRKYIPNVQNNIFMVAGSQDFVDSMNEMLLKMGIGLDNIKVDYFTGY